MNALKWLINRSEVKSVESFDYEGKAMIETITVFQGRLPQAMIKELRENAVLTASRDTKKGGYHCLQLIDTEQKQAILRIYSGNRVNFSYVTYEEDLFADFPKGIYPELA